MNRNSEPEKWRDTVDPKTLPLKTVKIKEVLGYPHAANQVFHLKADKNGEEGYYYLKYAFHSDANLKNETETLKKLNFPFVPELVEYDTEKFKYELTKEICGKRLSVILGDRGSKDAAEFMYEYGRTLALLHRVKGDFSPAPKRVFHALPTMEILSENGLEFAFDYLKNDFPEKVNECFIHGDFHYANILWKNGHISAVLDFELSGMGNREYDIAWAIILRPGQKFIKTETEREKFLEGYCSLENCDKELVRYYMVLIYSRFIKLGDEDYKNYVRNWIKNNIQIGRH